MAAAHDQTMNRVDSQHPAIKERINSSVLELLVIIFCKIGILLSLSFIILCLEVCFVSICILKISNHCFDFKEITPY